MYTEFFGFKERPFKLVPNPAYLFLGKSHQEAMAHLVYALHAGEGFVEITGEVGTGKTTLCRSFLENLDENTEAAYIFNPNLDSIELLKAINDEFGISSAADNAKDLVDTLNRFLMAAGASGKSILLLIDEAQNLSREVLEQIRLLSNLETTQNKLLQIVLVGQPELKKVLDSYELRQLRQRMTLSLYLEPFTLAETIAYVKHRLQIASTELKTGFDNSAIRMVYRYSQGIPRLINIACDRALLTAYGLNQRNINGKITRQAIKELEGTCRRHAAAPGRQRQRVFGLLAVLLISVAALFTAATLGDRPLKAIYDRHVVGGSANDEASAGTDRQTATGIPNEDKTGKIDDPIVSDRKSAGNTPGTVTRPDPNGEKDIFLLADILGAEKFSLSRTEAFRTAMGLWDSKMEMAAATAELKDDYQFFLLAARQSGLMLYRAEKDLDLIEKLNLPVIMKFHDPAAGAERFLVLSRIEGGTFFFTGRDGEKEGRVQAGRDDIVSYWTGTAFIPWKNFFSIKGEIPGDPPDESLITLKLLLRDIGYGDIELVSRYDTLTRMAVMDVQQKHDLPVDGVVGPMTKIVLYNEKEELDIPFLSTARYGKEEH